MKILVSITGLILLLYLSAALFLFLIQRSFIYHPTPFVAHDFTEKIVGAGDGAALRLIVGNEGLSEAVIYFGGNSESVADSAGDYIESLPDKTVYLVNYRGYGGSGGRPTEENLFNDATVIFDTVSKNHSTVSVIGRSLGSGVACWLASKRPVDKLVLVTPYDSILSIAKAGYRIFPVEFLLKDQFKSIDYAATIKSPVLALLAQHDVVIPAENSRRLIEAFIPAAEAVVLSGTSHNDLQLNPEYYPLIRGFLN
ncbi:hypothetical protein AB833_31525 [Chromatiales bacterium (ex Bugula neritina AB1)]|nr:hypothetical protein AB833_31525 [Chromatiales bacterium (ex Bugula neritina AB1)]